MEANAWDTSRGARKENSEDFILKCKRAVFLQPTLEIYAVLIYCTVRGITEPTHGYHRVNNPATSHLAGSVMWSTETVALNFCSLRYARQRSTLYIGRVRHLRRGLESKEEKGGMLKESGESIQRVIRLVLIYADCFSKTLNPNWA